MYKPYFTEWMSTISPKLIIIKFLQAVVVSSLMTTTAHQTVVGLEAQKISEVEKNLKLISQKTQQNNTGNIEQNKLIPVFQLSDIQPSDWAFSALQSLNRRYNCLVGYPNGTYRGNRALSRYEFAAGLKACLEKLNEIMAANKSNFVSQEDLVTLKRLGKDFTPELRSFTQRIDNLEAKTAQLEASQFSTIVKLSGEAIFALSGAFGGERTDGSGEDIDDNITLGNRARVTFNSSFTGRDRLRVRLQARDTARLERATGTNMARLGFQGDNDNELDLTQLEYRFRVGRQARIRIQARGGGIDDFAAEVNPLIGDIRDSGTGATSRFGRRNPILRQGGDAGLGINYRFSDSVRLGLGFTVDDADEPESGINRSPYGAIASLAFVPSRRFGIGLTYVRSFNSLESNTGSQRANDPFTIPFSDENDNENSIIANSYGAELAFSPGQKFTIGGWVGFTQATATNLPGNPDAEIFNYALSFAWADVGKEGNVAAIIVGQPPKVINNDFDEVGEDPDTSFHLEGFYTHRINDNISITPGLFVILNPEHDENNDTIYVGTLRTTLEF